MAETPSWLAPGNAAPAPTSAPLEVSAPASSTNNNAAAASSDDEKDLPSVILMMRLLNMGMAGGIITAAVRRLLTENLVPRGYRPNFTHLLHMFIDFHSDWHSWYFDVCSRNLWNLRRFVDLLLGDTTQILARHDCR